MALQPKMEPEDQEAIETKEDVLIHTNRVGSKGKALLENSINDDEPGVYPQCLEQSDQASQSTLLEEGQVDVDDINGDEQPSYFTHKDPLRPQRKPAFRVDMDENVILNAHIADETYIDTADLAERILVELKQYSIPQTLFADRILCRSQGTLSDLLRNPRPWVEMKSGKDTYRRMFNWLQQPLHVRLSILDLYEFQDSGTPESFPPATLKRKQVSISGPSSQDTTPTNSQQFSQPKRQRFLFTERQKSTLTAIFKETPRVSKDLQDKIAERLGLDSQTVANFFMNARRRCKLQKPKANQLRPENFDDYEEGEYDEHVDVTDEGSIIN